LQRTVSTPNEEIVRLGIDAYNRGDFEALLEHFDPAVVLHDPGRTGRSFHGHDGLMQFWGEWLENWDSHWLEPVEFVDDGEEIFVACEQRARGKLSGVEISQPLFSVYRFRDSKVVELRVYADRAPALDSMHG
jgi:ketosteroid isomerase-like protein